MTKTQRMSRISSIKIGLVQDGIHLWARIIRVSSSIDMLEALREFLPTTLVAFRIWEDFNISSPMVKGTLWQIKDITRSNKSLAPASWATEMTLITRYRVIYSRQKEKYNSTLRISKWKWVSLLFKTPFRKVVIAFLRVITRTFR